MIVVIFTVEKSLLKPNVRCTCQTQVRFPRRLLAPPTFLLARVMLSKEKARELLRDVQFPGKLASLGYEYGLHF